MAHTRDQHAGGCRARHEHHGRKGCDGPPHAGSAPHCGRRHGRCSCHDATESHLEAIGESGVDRLDLLAAEPLELFAQFARLHRGAARRISFTLTRICVFNAASPRCKVTARTALEQPMARAASSAESPPR